MTPDELWRAYCERNPQFRRPGNVTMTTAGLRKFFDQTYQKAFDVDKRSADVGNDFFNRATGKGHR